MLSLFEEQRKLRTNVSNPTGIAQEVVKLKKRIKSTCKNNCIKEICKQLEKQDDHQESNEILTDYYR